MGFSTYNNYSPKCTSIYFIYCCNCSVPAPINSITIPIGGGWTDDGAVVRLTTETDNVGIGTNIPTAKLDIIGKIKISDGTEGAGKVLTSDATGLATWQTPIGISGNVSGNGTPNFIPLWITSNSLGDSNMKIDANGNIILRPGSSIFVINADSSKCFIITGDHITKGPPCPSF